MVNEAKQNIDLTVKESDPEFNFLNKLNNASQPGMFDFLDLQNIDSPYSEGLFHTSYTHENDLSTCKSFTDKEFLLSINIQSLNAKHNRLQEFSMNFQKFSISYFTSGDLASWKCGWF